MSRNPPEKSRIRSPSAAVKTPEGAWEVRVGEAVLGYLKPGRRKRAFLLCRVRLRDVIRLIEDRHGGLCDDPDQGAAFCKIAINCIVDIAANPEAFALLFARDFTTMVDPADVIAMVRANMIANPPMRFSADQAAWLLKVTPDERKRLRITTIGSTGSTTEMREEERRRRKNERRVNAHRAAGVKPRKRLDGKPWEAEGIAKSTYYARLNKRPAGLTAPTLSEGEIRLDALSPSDPSEREISPVRLARDEGPKAPAYQLDMPRPLSGALAERIVHLASVRSLIDDAARSCQHIDDAVPAARTAIRRIVGEAFAEALKVEPT